MEEPETNDVDPERLIPDAIGGNQEALDLLMVCHWLTTMLSQICHWASRKFVVDLEDLRTFMEDTLRDQIGTISNPDHKPWCPLLKAWCRKVAKNRSLKLIRHRKVEQKHRDSVTNECIQFIRNGKRMIAPCANTLSPEEELMDQEQRLLEQRRKWALASIARQVVNSFPPKKAKIGRRWLAGKSTKQIIQETDQPGSTVYRILKEIQQAIVEEIGAREILNEQPGLAAGLQKLVARAKN